MAAFAASGRMAFTAGMLLLATTAIAVRGRVLHWCRRTANRLAGGRHCCDAAAASDPFGHHAGRSRYPCFSRERARDTFFDAHCGGGLIVRSIGDADDQVLLAPVVRKKDISQDDSGPASEGFEEGTASSAPGASAMVGGGAFAASSSPSKRKDGSDLPPPKRALTGRDEAGKSVFKSFDVTPTVVEIDSNPGLTFYDST